MTDESLREAIQKGLAEGRRPVAPSRKEEKATARLRERLAHAFNAASGVMEGLDMLKALPGSTFDYTVKADGTNVVITTNVPCNFPAWEEKKPLSVLVRESGRMTAYGDSHPEMMFGRYEEAGNAARFGGAERIVKFVAEYAAKRGLVP